MSVVLDKKKAEEFERSSELKVETESLVRSALQGAIASGQMGTIRVDPSYLQFESVLGKFEFFFCLFVVCVFNYGFLKIRCQHWRYVRSERPWVEFEFDNHKFVLRHWLHHRLGHHRHLPGFLHHLQSLSQIAQF